MRKTTVWLEEEDDERIQEIKKALRGKYDIQAIRYALHNCKLPRPTDAR